MLREFGEHSDRESMNKHNRDDHRSELEGDGRSR